MGSVGASSEAPHSVGVDSGVRSRNQRQHLTCVLVGVFCFVVYFSNFRVIAAGDAYPARYLPFVFWHWHRVVLDPIADIVAQGEHPMTPRKDRALATRVNPSEAFWIVRLNDGHLVSLYPLVVPLVVSPLYLPAVLYLDATGWEVHQLDRVARVMEKLSASLLASIGAALLFALLRRKSRLSVSLLLTAAYAFGSNTWMIGSQTLWQHGVAQLLLIVTLTLVTEPSTRRRAVLAGIVLGLIACNRPPDTLIAAALGVYALHGARGYRAEFIAAGLVPLIGVLIYNVGVVGHVAGAYGLVGDISFFQRDFVSGVAGLLFSPTRGLFVFSPFLLFVPLCIPAVLRDPQTRALGLAILVGSGLLVSLYGLTDWRQGACWGPRWLTELLPLLVWMLIPVANHNHTLTRAIFVVLVAMSVAIQAVGAYWYTGSSDFAVYAPTAGEPVMHSAWRFSNAPFLAELRHPPASLDLGSDVRGYIDTVDVVYAEAGRQLQVDGWALVDNRSPAEVVIRIDGRPVASTQAFTPRPDVANTLGVQASSGWHVMVPLHGLRGGTHLVAVSVRAFPDSVLSWIGQRQIDLPVGSGLALSANMAVDALQHRQHEMGYWLTSHTTQTRFQHAGVELNTYLQAMLVDLLAPLEDRFGTRRLVERARDYLRAQIEPNGLVRYHGVVNAPTIGVLGCAITPDADDTALTWRVAANNQLASRAAALQTLGEYRRADGLYRTWLAPRSQYQCIDPGADPDPADATIQMHVLMWLADVDRAASGALCSALNRAIDDDRIWVYYQRAPLVPTLRQIDLRAAGCALNLPVARQRTSVAGQDVWLTAASLLQRAQGDAGKAPSDDELRTWLNDVASDEFARVRTDPPLLYHNDLSASVSRYYWSQDFGYALWLRVYALLQTRPQP